MKAENGDLFIVAPGKNIDPATCSQISFQGPEIGLRFKPQVLTRFAVSTMHSLPSKQSLSPIGQLLVTPGCKCHGCTLGNIVPGQSLWFRTLQLGRIASCSPSFTACISIRTFQYYENGPQGRGLQVSSSFIHPGSVSKVCGALNNRVLPLSYGRQPRVMATAHFVLGDCYSAPASSSRGGFPSLTLGFF